MEFGIGFIIGFITCMAALVPAETKWQKRIYRRAILDVTEEYRRRKKHPIVLEDVNGDIDWQCPNCGNEFLTATECRGKYCSYCGCELDWSGEDGKM